MSQLNKQVFFSVLLILLALVQTFSAITYKQWKLFRVGPFNSTKPRSEFVQEIESINKLKIIDVHKENIEIGVGPSANHWKIEKLFQKFKVNGKLLHEDIGKLIKKTIRKSRKRSIQDDYFDSYMNIDQIERFFKTLADAYPGSIKLRTVGQSYEGRNVSLFIVSSDASSFPSGCKQHAEQVTWPSNQLNRRQSIKNGDLGRGTTQFRSQRRRKRFRRKLLRKRRLRRRQLFNLTTERSKNVIYLSSDLLKKTFSQRPKLKKPLVFVEAGLHSREWVSPAAVLYLIKKLAENPSLTSHLDWYIMPLVNPDGYKFSWENDRFWRKTRSKSSMSECFGVDMNRNFNSFWGEEDTSRNPCSENYGGTGPNSEVETQIIEKIISKNKNRLKAYISVHNWGQDILYPYCHSDKVIPGNALELKKVANGMAEAIKKAQGIQYMTGSGAALLYPASGTSMDWAYDKGASYSFLFEMRDKHGVLGFVLPDIFIRPTGEDLFAAMKYFASEVLKDQKLCPKSRE